YRIACDKAEGVNFDARLTRAERAKVETAGQTAVAMSGRLANGKGGDGLSYTARLGVEARGGTVTSEGGVVRVRKAYEALLVLSAATDYAGPLAPAFPGKDPASVTQQQIDAALRKGYMELTKAHITDYQAYFNRTTLELFAGPAAKQPTAERLALLSR